MYFIFVQVDKCAILSVLYLRDKFTGKPYDDGNGRLCEIQVGFCQFG